MAFLNSEHLAALLQPQKLFSDRDNIHDSSTTTHPQATIMNKTHPLLKDCPLIYTHKVTWGEMDAFNHVNNTEYFRYFEHARLAHFQQLGLTDLKESKNLGPILAETRCRFKAPLAFPDTLHIGVSVKDVGDDRFTHVYTVVSEKLNCVAAEGDGKIVFYDYNAGCKAKLPDTIRQTLLA